MGRLSRILVLSLACQALLPARADAERVRIKLDGEIRGEHAAFHVARDKGYFREVDIEVTVLDEGGPALNTLYVVSQGRYEFGLADLPSLIVARSQGVQVRALAALNQRSPLVMVALKGTGLRTPRDLVGRTVGVEEGTPASLFYGALLATHRIDRTTIREVPMPRPYLPLLTGGKAQVVPSEIGGELAHLPDNAVEILRGPDWGYDVLGAGLFTSQRLLRVNPGLARRFVGAYLRALRDVIDQPKEAIAVLGRSVPALAGRSDVLLRQLEVSLPTFTSEETVRRGLGWNPPERWQHTYDTLARAGLLRVPIASVAALYSNEFIGP